MSWKITWSSFHIPGEATPAFERYLAMQSTTFLLIWTAVSVAGGEGGIMLLGVEWGFVSSGVSTRTVKL
jgi:hypothetical protein